MNDFIISNFATFNNKLGVMKIAFQDLQNVKIYTSLDMETIFDPNAADDEYYEKYHMPLV